jgi:hypothetical protein
MDELPEFWGHTWDGEPPEDFSVSFEPESFTTTMLAEVSRRFESLPEGRAWCGFGTWECSSRITRIMVFIANEETRAMTVTRYCDDHVEMADREGGKWSADSLEEMLRRLEQIRATLH